MPATIPDMQYTIHQDAGVLAFLWTLVRPSILAKFKF
eukprot:SAG31_NODE_41928_length_273_cov_96.109195_1_plen_36_part_01